MDSLQNTDPLQKEHILKRLLPQIYKALLTALCVSHPNNPQQFVASKLMALMHGQHDLTDIDWHTFVDPEQHVAITSLTRQMVETMMESISRHIQMDDSVLPPRLFEKAYSHYRGHLTNSCFRGWKRFMAKRKSDAMELNVKMEMAKMHHDRKCQHVALGKWVDWLMIHKKTRAAAVEKLRKVTNAIRYKNVLVAWCHAVQESKRIKEYFEKLETGLLEIRRYNTGEGFNGFSVLPNKVSLKIFRYLGLQDLLNCSEVCCTWRAIAQTGSLWSRVNFSAEKHWITDYMVKQVLRTYRPFVIHLNMRGCTSLQWSSFTSITECRNLLELNLSECSNINDKVVQQIVESCSTLLYLNLSCTPVTNETLQQLSRSCVNLQYLSLAYCNRFTDKGLQYLATGKGCHKLIHLNLTGCTQMTVDGFRYVSEGCPLLRDIVINDMTTLSDSCVTALIARCQTLSTVSLLDTPHLSDIAFKAIADVAKLRTFATEGSDRITDVGWRALCRSSPGLRRLHASDCPRMTDASLKSVAALKHLQYLDISHCNNVTDKGIQYLTEGPLACKVRELNVSHCSRISDISVMRISERFSKLTHLNLSYCKGLSDSSLKWLSGNSSITSLDISGCNIQDQALSVLEGKCLKTVVLADCASITDTGIEKLCKRMRDLEVLDVSYCEGLSDQAIKGLSFYCRSLLTLRMAGCPKMTDFAVQCLMSGAHYLRELDVSGCVLLTGRSLCYLEKNCPPLRSISMAYCSGISKLEALRLRPRVEHWEHSRDTPFWFQHRMGQTL